MPFDGRNWDDAPLAYPHLYHPSNPVVGECLAHPLAAAYVHARHGGKLIASYACPQNAGNTINDTTWESAWLGYFYCAPSWTTIRASIAVEHDLADSAVNAYGRLTAYDSSGSVAVDDSVSSGRYIDVGAFSERSVLDANRSRASRLASVNLFEVEVPLADLTLPDTLRLQLDLYATGQSSAARPIRLISMSLWAESRG